MDFWKKLFAPKSAAPGGFSKPPKVSKIPPPPVKANASPPAVSNRPVEEGDKVTRLLLEVKKPRYAHMAKYHEQRGEFGEAESNYNMLATAFEQTIGSAHPDFATVLYELAVLNHYHEVPHAPEIEIIYNSLGRGFQVFTFYDLARQIRAGSLGKMHPAYAQGLQGLAVFEKDNQKTEDARGHIREALAIQSEFDKTNSLGIALSNLCLAELTGSQGDLRGAIQLYESVLQLLAQPSDSLALLEEARRYCEKARANSSDSEGSQVLTDKALALQRNPMVSDPYFLMTFDLLASRGSLILDILEIHRNQYVKRHRNARVNSLKGLAQAYQKAGEPARAIPLLEEAAELDRNSR
jgi:tetratricopeptide (TPR) repeat protein